MGEDAVGVGSGGGGFKGETGRPETVGMTVEVALALEPDVATGGHGLAHGPEIGGQEAVVWDADAAGFEGGTEFVGESFFDFGGEGDAFDTVAVEFLFGAFDELAAQAALVNAGPPDCRQGQEGIKDGFLGLEGLFLEANYFAGEEVEGVFFEDPYHGEIVETADVNAEVEGRLRIVECGLRIEGPLPGFAGFVLAACDKVVTEEGGIVVAGLAHKLLLPGFFVRAALAEGLQEIVIGPLEAVIARVGLAPFGFESIEEALLDGVLDGDGVEAEMLGVALVLDFIDQFVEKVGGAAMGGDDVHAAVPHKTWKADGEEWRLAELRANSSKTR